MLLKNYLKENGLTTAVFGEQIDAPGGSVRRYTAGRIPERSKVIAIFAATGGAVTPNDFYGIGIRTDSSGALIDVPHEAGASTREGTSKGD